MLGASFMIRDNVFHHKGNEKQLDIFIDTGTLRVIFIGCLAIAVSLMVMSFSSIIITKNAVVSNLKKVVIQYMAGSISSSIDARIERAIDASVVLSSDPTVIKWVQSGDKDEAAGIIAKQKMLELNHDLGYDTSFLANKLSGSYWSSDSNGVKLLYTLSKDNPLDSWFFNTLKMGKRFEINVNYDRKLHDTFVWINTLTGDLNNPIAVTGVGMNISKFIKDLIASDSKNGLNNEIWLVDDKGEIYLSKNNKYMNRNISLFLPGKLKTEVLNSDGSLTSVSPAEYKGGNGEIYDVVYKKIKNTNWNLVIQIPRTESLGFLNKIIYNTLLACFLVITIVIAMFNILSKRIADPYKRALLINQELEKKISERTKELNEQNAKILDSIEYAKVIQKTILPSSEEIDKIFDQYFVIWEPRDIVGGDFYWLRKFSDGILVVLGDCTGHGVPGALMTMAVNSILNHIVEDISHDDPAVILQELDKLLKQTLRREKDTENIQDGLDAGVLFISNESSIKFSGAQIPLWVGSEYGIKEIKGSRNSIGSDRVNMKKKFLNVELEHTPGMTLYMATDGFKDQPGGIRKLPFGKSRVISLLDKNKISVPGEQKKAIVAAYEAYIHDEMRRDDIAMIGIRI